MPDSWMCGERQRRNGASSVVLLLAVVGATKAIQPEDDQWEHRVTRESRIDGSTGRHLAWWARGPQVDFLHMAMEITIHDMEDPHLEAVERLSVRGLAGSRDSITLDCQGLQVTSVMVDGLTSRFVVADGRLTLWFPGGTIDGGQERLIEFRFQAEYPTANGLGLNWSLGDPGGNSETDRFAQIHTQGQAENNSRWFICHDAPNDRMSTELIVRVPDPYVVISNGRLVDQGATDSDLVTWHWLQERPHPSYLVSLVVGVFDRVELAGPGIAGPTTVPMSVYGPVGTAGNLSRVFEGTPAMLAFFERWLDEAYPWDRYDQVCVRNFHSGGMENTSATTLYEDAARSNRGREEDLISHELAHMWFGDLLTCRTWDHLWLNEGWATYSEVLWREERARQQAAEDGLEEADVAGEARRAMLEYMLQIMRIQRRFNRARAPMDPALVSNLYTDPEGVFDKVDDPYNKGAAILHMLRMSLGDAIFQAGVRLYLDRHKDTVVETDDFRRCLEDVSGRSLERFFAQWVDRPGLPRLDVHLEWIEGELVVRVDQRQPIDADNPAYAFDLPIEVRTGDDTRIIKMVVRERSAVLHVSLPVRPEQVAVDPNLSVFAATRVEKDLAWWRRELEGGSTIAVQHAAAGAIGSHPSAGASEWLMLASVAADAGVPEAVRRAASESAAAIVARGIARGLLPIAQSAVGVTGEAAWWARSRQ